MTNDCSSQKDSANGKEKGGKSILPQSEKNTMANDPSHQKEVRANTSSDVCPNSGNHSTISPSTEMPCVSSVFSTKNHSDTSNHAIPSSKIEEDNLQKNLEYSCQNDKKSIQEKTSKENSCSYDTCTQGQHDKECYDESRTPDHSDQKNSPMEGCSKDSASPQEEITANHSTQNQSELQNSDSARTQCNSFMNDTNGHFPLVNDDKSAKDQTKEIHHISVGEIEVITGKHCHVTITLHAHSSFLIKTKKEALKQITKCVSIPGFRKGRAPQKIVEERYAQSIFQKWEEIFSNKAFKECSHALAIPLFSHKDNQVAYNIIDLSKDRGEVSFSFERSPKIPKIDIRALSLNPTFQSPKDPSKEEIENYIKSLQLLYAQWKQIQDRPIVDEDFVTLDIDQIDDNGPIPLFVNTRFPVNAPYIPDWLKKVLIGKELHSSFETVTEPNATDPEEIKNHFQAKKMHIYIKNIEEAILPPVDEHFAHQLQTHNVDDLVEKISSLLKKARRDTYQEKLRTFLSQALLQHFPVDVPESLIREEQKAKWLQLYQSAHFAEKWKNSSEESKERQKTALFQQSQESLQLFFLCQQLAKDYKISCQPSENHQQQESILQTLMHQLFNQNQKKEQELYPVNNVIRQVQDFLLEKIRENKEHDK